MPPSFVPHLTKRRYTVDHVREMLLAAHKSGFAAGEADAKAAAAASHTQQMTELQKLRLQVAHEFARTFWTIIDP